MCLYQEFGVEAWLHHRADQRQDAKFGARDQRQDAKFGAHGPVVNTVTIFFMAIQQTNKDICSIVLGGGPRRSSLPAIWYLSHLPSFYPYSRLD